MSEKKVLALTEAEASWRLQFIGKCVDTNSTIPNSTKFGVNQLMTVQDLVNSSLETLQKIGTNIHKGILEAEANPFKKKEFKIGGIDATDWMKFLVLSVQNREYIDQERSTRAKINELKAQIHEAKTPEEKRREAEVELTKLEASLAV